MPKAKQDLRVDLPTIGIDTFKDCNKVGIKGIVVKSSQHFYAGFEPIAEEIGYINAPGDIPPDFANIAFTKVSNPFWPKEPGPFWTPVD